MPLKDLLPAMKSLGLSPSEQEVVDMQCEVEKKGRIFFPDFCKLCLRKFREFDEENFRQIMFKVQYFCQKSFDFKCHFVFRIFAELSHTRLNSEPRNTKSPKSLSVYQTSGR